MDWAEMLERMYTRWAGDQGFSCTASDRSVGEEAGIKGVELSIRGKWAYGYLKGEGGSVEAGSDMPDMPHWMVSAWAAALR